MPTTTQLPRRPVARLLPGPVLGVLGVVLGVAVALLPAVAPAEASPRVPDLLPTRALVQRTLENQVLALTNAERRAHGCGNLRASSRLRVSARRHTVAMANAGQMTHQLPGEAYFSKRITRAGYTGWRLVAENVARGFSGPDTVVDAWMASPGHRRNILNCKLRDLGVGVVLQDDQLWWTQNFGRR